MTLAVLGAGSFGTALAIALGQSGQAVVLWARDAAQAETMRRTRRNDRRVVGATLPENVTVTARIGDISVADTVLLAVPMQQLAAVVDRYRNELSGKALVGCAKGIDLATGRGTIAILRDAFDGVQPAILTGPSFAADIARGLPTALTLACADDGLGARLQELLSTPVLRVYRTTDTIGAELGGALKNVIAIAAGVVIGAGLGDSARAALMTRGFAEMTRLALALGAQADTLAGLSGLGDLVLTCTSEQSRNFRYGMAIGRGTAFDEQTTVEGAATAKAAAVLARKHGIDMPIADMVAALVDRQVGVAEAMSALMARPLKKE